MRDADASVVILQRLHEMGVRIAIDDFGTGYSSLLYLKRLPASELKIDRGFVRNLEHDSEDRAIVSAIVALGQTLDLKIVAEGVETVAQQEFLTDMGCDSLQGFLFGKPMPPAQFLAALAQLVRQLAAGIYTYLPLGRRVLRKLEQIVREEMDRAGAQEVLMPAMQPAELWQQSGRYEVYGPELIRLRDRHEREFTLGPTHEEVITALVRGEVSSYRQLPVTLYQIQTKFRDEKRPRYGLLRGREFLMKDAYSFDEDWEGLHRSYMSMYEAYNRIFTRCGLYYRAVEADAGSIGGEGGTHEFMALADIGEDTIAACDSCDYAANLEKAEYGTESAKHRDQELKREELERLHTPNIKKIDQLVQSLGVSADLLMKTLIYVADGNPVAVVVRGDHEVNEIKVKNALSAAVLSWPIKRRPSA